MHLMQKTHIKNPEIVEIYHIYLSILRLIIYKNLNIKPFMTYFLISRALSVQWNNSCQTALVYVSFGAPEFNRGCFVGSELPNL